MTTVKISSKYQIVIPKQIRRKKKLQPGQILQVVEHDDKIEFIPLIDLKKAKGFLKGIDTKIKRESDRV